jgi:hypothetical protein
MASTRSIVALIVDLVPERAGDCDGAILVSAAGPAARDATSRGKSAPFACKVGPADGAPAHRAADNKDKYRSRGT